MLDPLRRLAQRSRHLLGPIRGGSQRSLQSHEFGFELQGDLREYEVVPEDVGLQRWPSEAIRGGTPEENAGALRRILGGELGAGREVVLLNAAAALLAADRVDSLGTGVESAAASIDSGAARRALEGLTRLSQELTR